MGTKQATSGFDLWDEAPAAAAIPVPKKSHIPAVLPPHPGQSYNPNDNDYKSLIDKASKTELGELEKKEKYQKAIHNYKVVDRLPSSSDEESSSEDEASGPKIAVNAKTVNKKKTIAQRNKQKRNQAVLKTHAAAKSAKANAKQYE